ncbi:MAG: hypothetical protein MZV64_64140 [Ignavibacteriales bacterium]|nr:hypothetical protein [Ignavibacteriales bacterium]
MPGLPRPDGGRSRSTRSRPTSATSRATSWKAGPSGTRGIELAARYHEDYLPDDGPRARVRRRATARRSR